jgi:hypothetical protein
MFLAPGAAKNPVERLGLVEYGLKRGSMNNSIISILAFFAVVSTSPVFAADPGSATGSKNAGQSSPGKEVAQVPGDDIFGFTSQTDVGKPGDSGFANENDGRLGKRQGAYGALNTKYEFSRTVADGWWMAGSLFGAYYHAQDVIGLVDVNHLDFDGLSFEIEHRIVERSASQPFAISISVEPRWGRLDSVAGLPSNSYAAALKLFVDAPIVPDKLYWAANMIWVPQRAEDPNNRSQWLDTSITLISTALTYQISKQLFAGVEMRYLSAFNAGWLNNNIGHAIYAGPTMLWKINEKVALNTTFQPQIVGRSTTNPNLNLDLDNFERAQFRAKLAVSF